MAFLPRDSGVIWHRDRWSLCGRVTVLDVVTLKSKLQPNLASPDPASMGARAVAEPIHLFSFASLGEPWGLSCPRGGFARVSMWPPEQPPAPLPGCQTLWIRSTSRAGGAAAKPGVKTNDCGGLAALAALLLGKLKKIYKNQTLDVVGDGGSTWDGVGQPDCAACVC